MATKQERAAKKREDGRRALHELQQLPFGAATRSVLRLYITATLAGRRQDAGTAWIVRPLPSTNRLKDQRRIFTFTVSNMETLFAYYDPRDNAVLGGHLVVQQPMVGGRPVRELAGQYLDNIGHYDTAKGRDAA
ncbi:hypothetical protein [Actinopolymorpha rutila]|uniref:Uncharacterized protein n=1 Tax=Actinopolymorpha rutila TaxID=446787 RepID=A0A852ZJV6_9ACTN|nr:hypothetical protein [Actinopolymorpha rutila]NYH92415.1 hypothetical protein [Actinopolymorpha rutila]